jgi:hypothetical protein
MKCRPGIMARIVKPIDSCAERLVGETVMCLRIAARYDDGDVAWAIECGKTLMCACGENRVAAYPDSCMEPIEPPKNDDVDEMVKRLGPAKKVEMPPLIPVVTKPAQPVKPVTA